MTNLLGPVRLGGRRKGAATAVLGLLTAVALSACSSATSVDQTSQSSGAPAGDATTPAAADATTLTVDSSFILTSLDPARALTPTLSVATRGIYDTLLQTKGTDPKPLPSVAKSFDASADAKTYTFHLRDDVTFADGSKMTSADVLFSFKRLAALKLGGSYLMDGITVTAPDAQTVVLTSADPKPAIPAMVTTPAFVIVNSAMVKTAGGTDADNAPDADKADTWFNSNSAGSGPYVLQSYKTDDSIVMVRNSKYWGEKPKFDRIVIRNMPAATQLLNVQRGANEIALDLSATQSAPLQGKDTVTVKSDPSSAVFRVQMNMDPAASKVASNPHIQAAVRYGINYDAIVQLGGQGAVQAAGLIPSTVPGALTSADFIKQDVEKAKAEIAASGIANPSLKLTYPSDINVNGLEFATLAQRVAADLQAVGFTIKLEALPVATYLPAWRKGTTEMTVTYNLPDYMDPSYYTSFVPGDTSDALRAGWGKTDDQSLVALGKEINSTVDDAKRSALAQDMQRKFKENSPYIPLMQTAQTVVSSSNLTGVVLDPTWVLDVAAVGTK